MSVTVDRRVAVTMPRKPRRSDVGQEPPVNTSGPRLQTENAFPNYAPTYVINPLASKASAIPEGVHVRFSIHMFPLRFRRRGDPTGIYSLQFRCYLALLFVHLKLVSWRVP
jgi:hypothetical protein